jgi:hypothetical protein
MPLAALKLVHAALQRFDPLHHLFHRRLLRCGRASHYHDTQGPAKNSDSSHALVPGSTVKRSLRQRSNETP